MHESVVHEKFCTNVVADSHRRFTFTESTVILKKVRNIYLFRKSAKVFLNVGDVGTFTILD